MKGFKPWLVIALVFCAGIAVGVLGTHRVVRQRTEWMRDPKSAGEKVDSVRERMESELVSKLDLTTEQQTNVHQIFLESGEQMRKLHGEFEPRMKEIFDTAHQKIAATLSPEQKEKFEQITKERREHFEKLREKGFGHHGERPPRPAENR